MEIKMEVKKVITNELDENCYIFSSQGEGIIVDPGGNADKILKTAEGIKIKHILLTHGHFDHIMAANEVKRATGATLLVPKDDSEMLSDPYKSSGAIYGFMHEDIIFDKELCEGDNISFGAVTLTAMETPGHSGGSMCYIGHGVLISGDVLFRGTIGRFEFENKALMVTSLKKLWQLPQATIVYPGHGVPTTIGFEKENNPYVNMR